MKTASEYFASLRKLKLRVFLFGEELDNVKSKTDNPNTVINKDCKILFKFI